MHTHLLTYIYVIIHINIYITQIYLNDNKKKKISLKKKINHYLMLHLSNSWLTQVRE